MFQFGFHEEKGLRPTMEDALIINPSFSYQFNNTDFCGGLFGVIDGHGGVEVAEYVSKNLELILKGKLKESESIEQALIQSFEQVDLNLKLFIEKQKFTKIKSTCGAAANVCFITSDKVYCANLGDCRALVFIGESKDECECTVMSQDHKAHYEKDRMEQIGVKVVNTLPSRTFGDFQYKQPAVKTTLNKPNLEVDVIISTPEIKTIDISGKYGGVLIACDGLFDKLTNENVSTLYKELKFEKERSAQEISFDFCQNALEKKTKDNVSVVIIHF